MLHRHTPGERHPRFVTRAPTGTAQCRWALMMVMLPFAALLAGCRDGPSPTALAQEELPPTGAAFEIADVPQGITASTGPVTAAVALEDALARVLPALEAGGPTAALDAGLRQLHAQLESGGDGSGGLKRALTAVQNAIDMYQAGAGQEFQPDISVVQLALDAVAHG